MQGRNVSAICLKAQQDEVESIGVGCGRDNKYMGLEQGPRKLVGRRRRRRRAGGGVRFLSLGCQPGLAFPSNSLPELAGSGEPITLLLGGGTLQVPFRCLLL